MRLKYKPKSGSKSSIDPKPIEIKRRKLSIHEKSFFEKKKNNYKYIQNKVKHSN